MSRFYNMGVEISGHDASKATAIQEAAAREWEFDEWNEYDGVLTAYADSYLGGGESEEELMERQAQR